MNKKKLNYVLFIVFLFSFFNVEVKAAKEISCVYHDNEDAYKLVQNGNGSVEIYYGYAHKVVPNGIVAWSGEWTKQTKISLETYSSCDLSGISTETFKNVSKCPPGFIVKNKKKKEFYIVNQIPSDEYSNNCIITHSQKTLLKPEENGEKDKAYNDNSKNAQEYKVETHKERCENIKIEDLWVKDTNIQASCLYAHNLDNNKGCISVQLDLTSKGIINPYVKLPKNIGNSYYSSSDTLIGEYAITNNNGYCPSLYIKEETKAGDLYYQLGIEPGKEGSWLNLNYVTSKGKNLQDSSLDIADYNYDEFNIIFIDTTKDENFDCSDIFGEDEDLVSLLHSLVTLVKIAIPILVIVLGSLDFVNAIFAGEESKMKKAQGKFIKRLIIAVVIFLVPSMLHFILDIAHKIWPIIDSDLCGIL